MEHKRGCAQPCSRQPCSIGTSTSPSWWLPVLPQPRGDAAGLRSVGAARWLPAHRDPRGAADTFLPQPPASQEPRAGAGSFHSQTQAGAVASRSSSRQGPVLGPPSPTEPRGGPRRSTPSRSRAVYSCTLAMYVPRAGKNPTPSPCGAVLSHKGSRASPSRGHQVRWQRGQAPANGTVPWSCQDMAFWWGQQAGRAMQCLPAWLRAPHLVLTAAPGTQGLSFAARASLSAPIYICCVCKLRAHAAWQHRAAAEPPPQLCQPRCCVCASGSSSDPVTRLQSLFCPGRMALILEHAPRAAPSSPAVGP